MIYSNFKRLALAASIAGVLAACGGSDNASDESVMRLSVSALQDPGAGQVYTGWLKLDDASYVAVGTVSAASGGPTQREFKVKKSHIARAREFVLTLESSSATPAAPAKARLLAGSFNAGKTEATMSVEHPGALNTNFANASGRFFLATPVTVALDDEAQGIWFAGVVDGKLAVGLELPALPEGWTYEGWVTVNGKLSSTGRFTRVDAWDSDVAGPTAGPIGAVVPSFPGQDFLAPAVSLPGGMAVISVEPVARSSDTPFFIRPLSAPIANVVGGRNVQSLSNAFTAGAKLPQGSVLVVAD